MEEQKTKTPVEVREEEVEEFGELTVDIVDDIWKLMPVQIVVDYRRDLLRTVHDRLSAGPLPEEELGAG